MVVTAFLTRRRWPLLAFWCWLPGLPEDPHVGAEVLLGGLPVLLDAEVVDEGRAAAHGDHVDDGRHQVRVPEQHQARAGQ